MMNAMKRIWAVDAPRAGGHLRAFALLLLATVSIAHADQYGRYDFEYSIVADPRVRPIQVFDDGTSTFFQFGKTDTLPAVFRVSSKGPELMTLQFEGPYLKASGVAAEYLIRLGSANGSVVYTKPGRFQPVAAPANPPPSQWTPAARAAMPLSRAMEEQGAIALEANSYATPVKGDRMAWTTGAAKTDEISITFPAGSSKLTSDQLRKIKALAVRVQGQYSVRITARDDDELKEGVEQARGAVIRAALLQQGLKGEAIRVEYGHGVKEGRMWASQVSVISHELQARQRDAVEPAQQTVAAVSTEMPPDGFRLSQADSTLSGAVKRWASATNYQVVWDAPHDPVIEGAATLSASSMKDALQVVVADMRSKGYEVGVTIYANRVIAVTANTK